MHMKPWWLASKDHPWALMSCPKGPSIGHGHCVDGIKKRGWHHSAEWKDWGFAAFHVIGILSKQQAILAKPWHKFQRYQAYYFGRVALAWKSSSRLST
jgi:hypothetical protein